MQPGTNQRAGEHTGLCCAGCAVLLCAGLRFSVLQCVERAALRLHSFPRSKTTSHLWTGGYGGLGARRAPPAGGQNWRRRLILGGNPAPQRRSAAQVGIIAYLPQLCNNTVTLRWRGCVLCPGGIWQRAKMLLRAAVWSLRQRRPLRGMIARAAVQLHGRQRRGAASAPVGSRTGSLGAPVRAAARSARPRGGAFSCCSALGAWFERRRGRRCGAAVENLRAGKLRI